MADIILALPQPWPSRAFFAEGLTGDPVTISWRRGVVITFLQAGYDDKPTANDATLSVNVDVGSGFQQVLSIPMTSATKESTSLLVSTQEPIIGIPLTASFEVLLSGGGASIVGHITANAHAASDSPFYHIMGRGLPVSNPVNP